MDRTVRQLSLTCLLMSVILAQAARAQLQGGAMGEVRNSIGALDNSVHAEVEPSRPASSGGRAAPPTASSSTWHTKPGAVSLGARSEGSAAGDGIGGWSPARNGVQSARFRPSEGAALSSGRVAGSLERKTAKVPAETPKKEKGIKPLFPPGGAGPEPQPEPFARREFTGKVHYSFASAQQERKRERQKLANQLKGPASPGFVSKKKHAHRREQPSRELQTKDQQGCDDASRLRLCTWFSAR